MMNFRLVRQSHLVDLNRVGELSYLRVQNDELRIGAMARQRELERSAAVAEQWPLLGEAAGYIAHVQIRHLGTVGGSPAHAYPSAELPVVMSALEAKFVLRSQQGEWTLLWGSSVCTTTLGLRGSVTSTPVKFFGGPSWANHMMRRPSLTFCMDMPSPMPPKPPRLLWPKSFIFKDSSFCI